MNIKKTLKYFGIKSLYHFTDRSNLTNIEKYGLQSLDNIAQKNITVSRFGADSLSHNLDRTNGLDHFVHLAFIKDHPMYHIAKSRGSIIDPIWLNLDISVLFDSLTLISDKVANGSNANIFKLKNILNFIDFDILINSTDFHERKEARKAEIMVKNYISINKILGVSNGY